VKKSLKMHYCKSYDPILMKFIQLDTAGYMYNISKFQQDLTHRTRDMTPRSLPLSHRFKLKGLDQLLCAPFNGSMNAIVLQWLNNSGLHFTGFPRKDSSTVFKSTDREIFGVTPRLMLIMINFKC